MSKLSISTEKRKSRGDDAVEYVYVRMEGFIDAPNYMTFETALDKLSRAGEKNLVLDFRRVQYINSTGISAIIRFHHAASERGGSFFLIQVPRNVGVTMHLLGVTSIVPFLKTLEEAEDRLERREASPGDAVFVDDDGKTPREVPVLVEGPPSEQGTVIVAVPKEGPFTEILRARLGAVNGNYHLVHSIDDLRMNLDSWRPDLIVLDHRLSGVDAFIEELKMNVEHSLTSVICLYQKGTDVRRLRGFRVWENDFLVDPFEMMNLFVLTESELRRVPRDRQLFGQQVRFDLDCNRESVDKSLGLANKLIQRLGLGDNDTTALYAAVKEGIDNAVLHGNKHHPDRRVAVNFLVDNNKVTFMIEDEGEGFDYEYYLSQIDSQEAFDRAKARIRAGGRGGLGILLMHKCSDRLEYAANGNLLRIEKNLN